MTRKQAGILLSRGIRTDLEPTQCPDLLSVGGALRPEMKLFDHLSLTENTRSCTSASSYIFLPKFVNNHENIFASIPVFLI